MIVFQISRVIFGSLNDPGYFEYLLMIIYLTKIALFYVITICARKSFFTLLSWFHIFIGKSFLKMFSLSLLNFFLTFDLFAVV